MNDVRITVSFLSNTYSIIRLGIWCSNLTDEGVVHGHIEVVQKFSGEGVTLVIELAVGERHLPFE